MSIQSEANPFDPKKSMMIALASSITLGSDEYVKEQTKMPKKMDTPAYGCFRTLVPNLWK